MGNILWPVLAISIHEDENIATRRTRPGLDGRAIAHAVRLGNNKYLMPLAERNGIVGRPVVHNDDLGIWYQLLYFRQKADERCSFVFCGQNYGQLSAMRHL